MTLEAPQDDLPPDFAPRWAEHKIRGKHGGRFYGMGGPDSERRKIMTLALQGYSDKEIAVQLGKNLQTVKSTVSQGRMDGIEIPYDWQRGVLVRLAAEHEAALFEEAVARNLTVRELASRIVATVVRDNLYNAVLDDGEKP